MSYALECRRNLESLPSEGKPESVVPFWDGRVADWDNILVRNLKVIVLIDIFDVSRLHGCERVGDCAPYVALAKKESFGLKPVALSDTVPLVVEVVVALPVLVVLDDFAREIGGVCIDSIAEVSMVFVP